MRVNSEGSGETVLMNRLARTFTVLISRVERKTIVTQTYF